MPRVRSSNGFTALRVEGSILPPEYLQAVAGLEATHQASADYGLSESLVLKEEIARFWRIANDRYARYSKQRVRHDLNSREVGVDKWLVFLLRTVLGYEDLVPSDNLVLEDRVFKLTHLACDQAVPHLLTTSRFDLDKADPHFGYEGRRQSPHGLLQEYLNAEDKCLWGLVSNGSKLRILRDNSSLTRPSYLEVDLDLVFTEELYPDFVGFWLAVHATRLAPVNGKASGCIFEGWRAKAHETGERVLADLRDGVAEALQQIGSGFLQHPGNSRLRAAFGGGGGNL